jgi:hypothetical protein
MTETEVHDGSLAVVRVFNSGSQPVVVSHGTQHVTVDPGSAAEFTTGSTPVTARLEHIGAAGEVTVTDASTPPVRSGLPIPDTGDAGKVVTVNEAEDGYELAPTATSDAVDVTYDNDTSSLTATDVQAAIDELTARIVALETP